MAGCRTRRGDRIRRRCRRRSFSLRLFASLVLVHFARRKLFLILRTFAAWRRAGGDSRWVRSAVLANSPGQVPFWKGDSVGRPKELGKAIGAFTREAVDWSEEKLVAEYDLDERAARNLLDYLREQQAATRVLPSDRTIVVERFRDEIGDWRLCVLSPYGGRVHAAWGLALSAKIRDELGLESDAIWSDDGIIVHLPDADEPPGADSS